MGTRDHNVTRLIQAAAEGNAEASDQLLPAVYEELRILARAQMAREAPGNTLQPTALVHEAYMRLIGDGGGDVKWNSKAHFFGAAARAMRRILVDRARRRGALKRGGDRKRLEMDNLQLAENDETAGFVLDLDVALERLEALDERKSRIVMLRFFAGLSIEETASAMDLSKTVIKQEWQFARAWLYNQMEQAE